MGNQRVAENDRKGGAANSDRNRLNPGETPPFEQDVRQF